MLGKEKLGDTRLETKRKTATKPSMKKTNTIAKTIAEGTISLNEQFLYLVYL